MQVFQLYVHERDHVKKSASIVRAVTFEAYVVLHTCIKQNFPYFELNLYVVWCINSRLTILGKKSKQLSMQNNFACVILPSFVEMWVI